MAHGSFMANQKRRTVIFDFELNGAGLFQKKDSSPCVDDNGGVRKIISSTLLQKTIFAKALAT
jgi:hypothetical protein